MSQLPLVTSLASTDKVLVLKSGVSSLANVSLVTDNAFVGKTTSNLTEGTNLYYTNTRVRDKVLSMFQEGANITLSYNSTTEKFTIIGDNAVASVAGKTGAVSLNTSDITEGSNLYYTDARVLSKLVTSLEGGANVTLNYDSGLGVVTINSTGNVQSVNSQTGNVILNSDNISEGVSNKYYSDILFGNSFLTRTTSHLAEGSNLYFTETRVRATTLSGMPTPANVVISSTDTLPQAISSLQGQISYQSSSLTNHSSNTANPHNVTKTQVGLGNVPNIDVTNATNISSGTLADARLSANITAQGNTFNSANQLVKLNGSGQLPALDGSLLTNVVTQLTDLTDVGVSGLSAGQTLYYTGSGWTNITLKKITRHDFNGGYSYCGKAPYGSSETSAVWVIKRIQILADGNTVTTTANNVTWSGRLTHTYS